MIHAFLPFPDVLAARQGHGSPLSDISNGELMESAKKKNQINGCPDFPDFHPSRFESYLRSQKFKAIPNR